MTAREIRSTRHTGGFKNFGEQLLAIGESGLTRTLDPRLQSRAATGLSEAVPSDGGFLVHPEFLPNLLERLYQTGEILSRCTEIPITQPNANSLKFAQFDESSRANGSRFGGVQAYWANEAGTSTPSCGKFSTSEVIAHKLIALVYVTSELVDDASSLGQFTTDAFAKEMAFTLESAIVGGTGAGQPLGILNSPALITVPKETGQAGGTIVAQNVVKAWLACGRLRARAACGSQM